MFNVSQTGSIWTGAKIVFFLIQETDETYNTTILVYMDYGYFF